MGPPAAHFHLRRVARPTSVLDVDALHRHLRASRFLEDDLRTVVQIVAIALRTPRAWIPFPLHLARIAREPNASVVERLAA